MRRFFHLGLSRNNIIGTVPKGDLRLLGPAAERGGLNVLSASYSWPDPLIDFGIAAARHGRLLSEIFHGLFRRRRFTTVSSRLTTIQSPAAEVLSGEETLLAKQTATGAYDMSSRQRLTSLFRQGSRIVSGKPPSLYLSIWRQRQDLAELSDHQLKDIGLTRSEAQAEARRRIWDI